MPKVLKFASNPMVFLCGALLLLLFPGVLFGQITNVTGETSTPIPGAGHDYIKMLSETVNPGDGSVSVRISVPVPKSRGITIPFSFAYDSNGVHLVADNGEGSGTWASNNSYLASGGWSYTVPMLTQTEATQQRQYIIDNMPYYYTCSYFIDYVFEDPTGGRHALGLSYVPPSTDCQRVQYPPTSFYSGGDDYYSASMASTYPFPVTVTDLDGTQYSLPGYGSAYHPGSNSSMTALATTVTDRNGNQASVDDLGGGAFNIIDTVGRAVSSSGFGSSGNTVNISGLPTPSYTITWGTASANFSRPGDNLVLSDGYCNGGIAADQETQPVITAISLPNGQEYQFKYDSTYGLLNKIIYPDGGYVRYVWGTRPLANFIVLSDSLGNANGCQYEYDSFGVAQRFVSFDGTTEVLEQDFGPYTTNWSSSPWWRQTPVTSKPTGEPSFETIYQYSAGGVPGSQPNNFGPFAGLGTPIPVEQTVSYYNDLGSTLLETKNEMWWDQDADKLGCQAITMEEGSNPTSSTLFYYLSDTVLGPALVTGKYEYDFGTSCPTTMPSSPPTTSLLRQTVTTYWNSSGKGILDRPSSMVVSAGGSEVAETDYPSYDVNGNALVMTQKCLINCTGEGDATTDYRYDSHGQVTSMTDPRQNITYYYYDSNDLYVTQIQYPPTNGVAHNVEFQHNSATGLMTQSTDQNSQPTKYVYNDPLDRLTEIDYPDGGKSSYGYGGNACGQPSSTVILIQGASTYNESATLDGLCHVTQTAVTSDPGGPDYADTTYDGLGRVWRKSNPHRGGWSSTDGTTAYTYDALGRVTLVVPPDGTAAADNVSTAYAGNRTTVTDQAGSQRGYVHDALGRLTEVDEPGTAQIAPTAISSEDPSSSGALAQAAAESEGWLASQQVPGASVWEGNALPTQSSPQFQESGIYSVADLSTLPQTAIENIVIDPPAGVTPDSSTGLDGFPINYSPLALPQGNVFLNVYQNPATASQTLTGHCFNLLNSASAYRVDLFTRADVFYYQGSASLVSTSASTATWSFNGRIGEGAVLAVLYPTSVLPPAPESYFATIPAGWIVHSNSGVGKKLAGYKSMLFVDTDMEYVQEDNVPIIVQDSHHARAGSSVIPVEGAGKLTVQVAYEDPVSGYVTVYDSLETLAGLQGLPLSFDIPTNDPLYVAWPGFSSEAAIQNRSFIYDNALAIIAYSAAGNYASANDIIQQLNYRVDNPDYMATRMLENAEDGSTSNWSATNGTVTNISDPTEPSNDGQALNSLDFHANAAGATFTYVGNQLPDLSDTMISFEHKEPSTTGSNYIYDIGVTSSTGMVTDVLVTSDTSTLPTYNSASKAITIPNGLGTGAYGTTLEGLPALITSLTGDTLTSITGFKVTLGFAGDTYFNNLSVGNLQPANSLSFSYDVYNGNVDQAYIEAGAMAWVVYAYCVYMQQSQDYTPALYVQKMINFLETLKSSASDLTNSLYYMGWGTYQNPGYQYVPGLRQIVSTEHQGDIYFAYKLAAGVLPTAAAQLWQQNQITQAQANSLNTTASTISSEADTIWANVSSVLYIAPNGGTPGHFAQGVSGTALDTSQALDASGTWSALLAHAAGDDAIATQCLEFVYQNFYLTQQQILESSANSSYNLTYQQLTPFSGFKPYNDSPGGYSGSPASVWQEGTWGMVDALVQLQNVPDVQTYFNTLFGGTGTQGEDTFLTTLVNGQLTVWDTTQNATTGQDSMLGYSLAARGLPWEFEVWPMLSATSWFWITSTNPTMLFDPPGKPSGASPALIPQANRKRLMARIEDHRTRGRRLADRKHGVLSPEHLKKPVKGALGPGDPPTYYTYDALDNLLSVQQQGGTSNSSQWRTRTFVYDSLSRLTSASNPESGTTVYSYDANSNLTSKTDARGTTTCYGTWTGSSCNTAPGYDADNRLLKKTYSSGDPAVSYSYDQGGSAANAIGRRSGMTDAAGTESWTYDKMGRVQADQRTTNRVTKTTSYTYYLEGSLETLTYPSGRVMTYQVGGAELPLSANDATNTYAASATYTPGGALAGLALGGGNINFSEAYSSRLQPTRIQASSTGGTDLFDLSYDFGLGVADNGNVRAILNGRDNTRSQFFAYDALNRITLAATQVTTGQNAWGQAFGYDPWGNLLTTALTQGAAPSSSVSVNGQNQIVGYCYDAAGDLLDANACPSGHNPHTYAYNAEGQMTSAVAGGYTYTYDGDGRRVEKSGSKLYWYGSKGEVLTETNLSGNLLDDYVFLGGRRVARVSAAGSVDYYFSDQLGSSRVVINSTGNLLDDSDFYPFGWERPVTSSSGNTYKFTGKERDAETGNDNFGARYYGSNMGRWIVPDRINLTRARLINPSNTLNKYAYAANNPLKYIDRDGEDITIFYRPKTGGSGDMGHIMMGALNQSTGKVAFLDFYPAGKAGAFGKYPGALNQGDMSDRAADNAAGKFATITIQTSPEEAQKVIDLIEALKNGPAPDWSLLSQNCTTLCEDVLQDLGLDFGDLDPGGYWGDVYNHFSAQALAHPIWTPFIGPQATPGNEYGNPRNYGIGIPFSQWLFQLYMNQLDKHQPTSCVEVNDNLGNHSKSCS